MSGDRHLNFDLAISRQLLLGETLARNARKFPTREVLVFKETRFTYRRLDERVNRLANALLAQGVKQGDKIGVLMKNRQEVFEIFYAMAKIGAVNIPLNIRLAPREIAYILNNGEARVLFVEGDFQELTDKMRGELSLIEQYIVVERKQKDARYADYEQILASGSPVRPEVWVEDDDDAFILYTSGTTGYPKGAILSHKNLVINAMTMNMERGTPSSVGGTEKYLTVAPLFHIAAITGSLMTMIAGGTFVVQDFDALEILKTIEREKITRLFLVPSMWLFLLDHPDLGTYDVSSIKAAEYGAAIMPAHLKKRILAAFPHAGLRDTFGQTEMSPCTTTLNAQYALSKESSVGLPIANVDVRVVDEDMNDVPVGEVGEIVYRGPNMFKGYYKNPKGTAEAFQGGWFHSGDLVRRDEEGFVYVVDRKKDMIISGGENIYPAEIEAVLHTHPKIMEAAIIGVADHQWGETVKAYVVVKPGMQLNAEEVISFCMENLGRFKRPRYVEFIPALPRSAAGKILKRELREQEAPVQE